MSEANVENREVLKNEDTPRSWRGEISFILVSANSPCYAKNSVCSLTFHLTNFIYKETSMASEKDRAAAQSPRGTRLGILFFVVAPFIALVLAIWIAWGRGVYVLDIGQLIFWHFVTGAGVTVGFHRLFTHASFKTRRPVKALLGILGSMTVQGSLFKWCAVHMQHHSYSDQEGDPHSPHAYGEGFWAVCRGFWHAHVGWLFSLEMPSSEVERLTKRLRADSLLVWIDRLFLLWILLGLLLPALIGGLVTGSLEGAFRGFLWGGLIRVGTVHHVTWSINSVCHIWGRRDFETGDESRNNVIFGLLGWGEGWHNGHHAFLRSAKHGLLRWQLDPTWWMIKTLSWLKLAWDIKLPTAKQIESRIIST